MSSVTKTAPRPESEALFLLGANLGEREATLEQALFLLQDVCGPLERSALCETPPWGDADQPPFLNVAARARTSLAPLAVLRHCKEIEQTLGRVPTRRWGPRIVDVDLIAYGRISLFTPELTLPHPRLHERAFVLVPLAELSPDWVHPLLERSVRELLSALPEEDVAAVRRLGSGAH